MTELAKKTCVPCRGGVPPLPPEEKKKLLLQLKDWQVIEDHHLHKVYRFEDFASALAWVNSIGAIAEEQDHHPDIYLTWGKVQVDIWTHKINNLTESDFVLAAKFDEAEKGA